MELFGIAGEQYYFDLKSISDFVRVDEEEPKNLKDLLEKEENEDSGEELSVDLQGPMVDMTKWELTKGLMEAILSEQGVVDEAMGIQKLEDQLSIPFKLAFNTLIKHKLIKRNRS
jgi:hypothetical protein